MGIHSLCPFIKRIYGEFSYMKACISVLVRALTVNLAEAYTGPRLVLTGSVEGECFYSVGSVTEGTAQPFTGM